MREVLRGISLLLIQGAKCLQWLKGCGWIRQIALEAPQVLEGFQVIDPVCPVPWSNIIDVASFFTLKILLGYLLMHAYQLRTRPYHDSHQMLLFAVHVALLRLDLSQVE